MGLKIPGIFIDTHGSWNLRYGHEQVMYVLLLSFGPSKRRKAGNIKLQTSGEQNNTEGSQNIQTAIFS